MALEKSPELWQTVISIEEIAPGDRLKYLLELPPGGIHWALLDAKAWLDGPERMLVVAIRSLSKIECDTSCEDARFEARDTLEAILDELVSWLNFEFPGAATAEPASEVSPQPWGRSYHKDC